MSIAEIKQELKEKQFRLTGYFIGGRTPRDDQMPAIERLREEISILEKRSRQEYAQIGKTQCQT